MRFEIGFTKDRNPPFWICIMGGKSTAEAHDMKTTLTDGFSLVVEAEPGDPKFHKETAFWYALKKHLNAVGHDLVKKVMSKDGHMYGGDTYPYYLRDRRGAYCFYDTEYALREIHKQWNTTGRVVLAREPGLRAVPDK